ncbi:MAG TPA: diacylglycerol kinase family protein [Phycisphaerales bacterium]|jgi:diacylglycerol kinase family enzyme|nr:diacylglycerol kinase family protein [Phycisphaerales bacterium]
MNIVLLNNPKSGRGTGAASADRLAEALSDAGHEVVRLAAGTSLAREELLGALRSSRLLVAAGGDGTLHHALPAIIASGVAVYHFPLGTENLFTREFGMTSEPSRLVRAIENWRVRACDAGEVNGRPFGLMASVGFDACVVERVAAGRRGGVTRADYVRSAMSELMNARVARVSVRIDGRLVVGDSHGLLVVANSRQYAARLDPAVHADMSDGQLDVVFFPYRTSIGLARWLLASAAGVHTHMSGIVIGQGRAIEVDVDKEWPLQIDGEAAGGVPMRPRGRHGLDIRVLPGVLNVLVP